MLSNIQNITYIILSLFFLLSILFAVKKSYLQLKYSLVWLTLSVAFVSVAIFPKLLVISSAFLQIATPVNALFLIVLAFLIILILQLTIVISKNKLRIKTLTQRQALSVAKFPIKSDVLIIIPAYNEVESILKTIADIKNNVDYDFLVINDCSRDDTLHICQANKIPIVDLPINLGIGGAVQTGYIYARDNGYKIAVQFDGDAQHDAAYLHLLTEELKKGSDIVIGSRFLSQDKNGGGYQSSLMRRVGINYFKFLIKILTGVRITDATSGMRAVGEEVIKMFATQYPVDYPEPESIVKSLRSGFKISEVPVVMRRRQGGVSSISPLKSVYYMIKVTLAILIANFGK